MHHCEGGPVCIRHKGLECGFVSACLLIFLVLCARTHTSTFVVCLLKSRARQASVLTSGEAVLTEVGLLGMEMCAHTFLTLLFLTQESYHGGRIES